METHWKIQNTTLFFKLYFPNVHSNTTPEYCMELSDCNYISYAKKFSTNMQMIEMWCPMNSNQYQKVFVRNLLQLENSFLVSSFFISYFLELATMATFAKHSPPSNCPFLLWQQPTCVLSHPLRGWDYRGRHQPPFSTRSV